MKIIAFGKKSELIRFIDLQYKLEKNSIIHLTDADQVIRFLERWDIDLLVVHTSGLLTREESQLLRWKTERHPNAFPVFVIADKKMDESIDIALNYGADEYLVRPFSPNEMTYRVRACLRRSNSMSVIPDGKVPLGVAIDSQTGSIRIDGIIIKLTNKEFEIASLLFNNMNVVVPREFIIKAVWGRNMVGHSRSLDTHVYKIKRKLALTSGAKFLLKAVHAYGYQICSAK